MPVEQHFDYSQQQLETRRCRGTFSIIERIVQPVLGLMNILTLQQFRFEVVGCGTRLDNALHGLGTGNLAADHRVERSAAISAAHLRALSINAATCSAQLRARLGKTQFFADRPQIKTDLCKRLYLFRFGQHATEHSAVAA